MGVASLDLGVCVPIAGCASDCLSQGNDRIYSCCTPGASRDPRPMTPDTLCCFLAIAATDRKQMYVSAANFLQTTRRRRFRNNRQKALWANRPAEEMMGATKPRLLPGRFPDCAAGGSRGHFINGLRPPNESGTIADSGEH